MTNHARKPKPDNRWTAEHEATMQQLAAAAQEACQEKIRMAVDAAREAGVGWTRIGDTLGMARGNAYQRYRTRPSASEGPRARVTDDDAE